MYLQVAKASKIILTFVTNTIPRITFSPKNIIIQFYMLPFDSPGNPYVCLKQSFFILVTVVKTYGFESDNLQHIKHNLDADQFEGRS